MNANVERVISNLNNQETAVAATCRDWAGRDETYAFLGGSNASGPSGTFNQPVLLGTLDIDYLLIYDTSGQLVFSEEAQASDGTPEVIPAELQNIIGDSIIPVGVPGGVSGRKGVAFLNGEPVILAGYAIRGSDQSEPSRGTLVMVRALTSQRMGDMESVLQIPDFTIGPSSVVSGTGVFSPTDIQKMKKGQIVSQPVNNSLMGGTAMVSGIEDTPTYLALQVFTDRTLFTDVQTTILIIAFSIVILIIIFIVAVQFLLQRFVLSPFSALDNDMKIIGQSGDLSRRIPEKGDDEIVSVTRALNQMLTDLEEKRAELSAARSELAERNRDLEEFNRKANLYLDIYLDVITYEILNAIMGLRGYAEYLNDMAQDNEKKFLKRSSILPRKAVM